MTSNTVFYPRLAVLHDNGPKVVPLKATQGDDKRLYWSFWELASHILPDVDVKKENFRPNKAIQTTYYGWMRFVDELAPPLKDHWVPSIKACSARKISDAPVAQNCWSFSTFGIMSLLAWAATHRGTILARRNAKHLCEAFLCNFAHGVQLEDVEIPAMMDGCLHLCRQSAVNGVCYHVQKLFELDLAHMGPGDELLNLLIEVMGRQDSCKTIASFANEIFSSLAKFIEETFEAHGFSQNSLKDGIIHRGAKRRRTTDVSITAATLRNTTDKLVSPVMLLNMVHGGNLKQQDFITRGLVHHVSAAHRHFADEDIVLTCGFDGAKFGSPQEETELYHLTDGAVQNWSPPMV